MNKYDKETIRQELDLRELKGIPSPGLRECLEYIEDLEEDLATVENDALSWESSYMRQIDLSEELERKIENLEREKALLVSNIEDLETALEDLERRHEGCP